jgi:hypothetical protein
MTRCLSRWASRLICGAELGAGDVTLTGALATDRGTRLRLVEVTGPAKTSPGQSMMLIHDNVLKSMSQ